MGRPKFSEFSEIEKELIVACDTIKPIVFLEAVKTQMGSFVTNNELEVVKDISSNSKLPDSVINVLIHYILVIKACRVVNGNLANAIANDWSQKGVTTSAEAMIKTRILRDDKRRKNNEAKSSYQKSSKRKETLPEWAKEENKVIQETPVSDDEEAYFKNQIEKLNQTK